MFNKPFGIFGKSCVSQQETETSVAIRNRKGVILRLKVNREGWRSGRFLLGLQRHLPGTTAVTT